MNHNADRVIALSLLVAIIATPISAAAYTCQSSNGNALVLDAQNRIVVTGGWGGNRCHPLSSYTGDMITWRFNGDGALDPAFNGAGYVIQHDVAGGASSDIGDDLVVDKNGNILITGTSKSSNQYMDMVIWRYRPDGTLDTGFNGTGYVIHSNAAGGDDYNDYGYAIALDSQGRIIVSGVSNTEFYNPKLVLWRYNPDGSLDTSFNGTGYVVRVDGAGGYGLAVDANDRILVTGAINGIPVVFRYKPDGALDKGFNGKGYADLAGVGDARDLTLDAQGRILAVGSGDDGSGRYMVLWRINADGTLDTSFNGTGYASHRLNDYWTNGFSLTEDPNGKILVAGDTYNGQNYDMVIWRYNADGTLDTAFNGKGYLIYASADPEVNSDVARDLAVAADGSILITGGIYGRVTSSYFPYFVQEMVLWRYHHDTGQPIQILATGTL